MALGPTYNPDGTTGQWVPPDVDSTGTVEALVTALHNAGIVNDVSA